MRSIKLGAAAAVAIVTTAVAAEPPGTRTEGDGTAAAGNNAAVAPQDVTARIIGLLRQQLAPCLTQAEISNLPALRIDLKLNQDGTLAGDAIVRPDNPGDDAQSAEFQVAAKSAAAAIRACAPFTLPAQHYDLWKDGFGIRIKLPKPDAAATPDEAHRGEEARKREEVKNDLTRIETALRGRRAPSNGTAAAGTTTSQDEFNGLVATLRDQLMRCWALPAVTTVPPVTVRFELNQDGTLARDPVVLPAHSYGPQFQVAAASALRAVRTCTPLRLPVAQYDRWRVVDMVFDPGMYGRK
jgi:hypothetical protein